MKLFKYLFLLVFVSLVITSCSDKEDADVFVPKLVSYYPADGSVELLTTVEISLAFDEPVKTSSNHKIVINDIPAIVERSLKDSKVLLIKNELEFETTYKIYIPKESVINNSGNHLEEDISFTFTTKEGPKPVEIGKLVASNPSPEAVKVFDFLKENYGEKTISATMSNVSWNMNEAEWVKLHTDKYPAMITTDYIHLPASPANWIDYSKIEYIEDWWENNGLFAAGWHWIVPRKEGETNSNDFTYKPNETTFKAKNVLIEGTWENDIAKADLEKLANYLLLLKDKNIPVIWRPFHEAAGNIYEYNNGTAWFWWGAGGAETYKQLWKYMFEFFEEKGLNNLIWVWTTQTKDDAFYPGDEYVDIIGRDIYNMQSASSAFNQFGIIQEKYSSKLVALSEFGNMAKISAQWEQGAKWSYFMPWYDYDRTNNVNTSSFEEESHEHANVDWWRDAMNSEFVITLDDMPSLK